jgi:hypothetical protein
MSLLSTEQFASGQMPWERVPAARGHLPKGGALAQHQGKGADCRNPLAAGQGPHRIRPT